MKEIRQTHDKGCFQAAIASILEMDIKDVPDFASKFEETQDDKWWDELQEWLKPRGWLFFEIHTKPFPSFIPIKHPFYCVIFGTSPTTGAKHAVVGILENGTCYAIFDPLTGKGNGECEGVLRDNIIDGFGFLIPWNPRKLKLRRETEKVHFEN